jgi:hypothetical protein
LLQGGSSLESITVFAVTPAARSRKSKVKGLEFWLSLSTQLPSPPRA